MDDSIFDIFREEAREHIGALEKGFLDLEATAALDARRSLIDNLFRHAHSLKGDAKAMGLLRIKESSQALEDLLDSFRDRPDQVNAANINDGLKQFDQVRSDLENWQREDQAPPPPQGETKTPAAVTVEAATTAHDRPAAVPAPFLPVATDESFTVRVPSERLDRMLNMAGEIRISQRSADAIQSRLADLSEHIATTIEQLPRLSESEQRQSLEFALDQLRRVGGALHNNTVREELLMEGLEKDIRQARLLPLLMLADFLRRAIRDLAQTLNKEIRYEADVGQIMLDKAVIEALKDPLLHLIRNAADHGIESPQARRTAGKPAEGVIRIHSEQNGQMVHITISDDGHGIDFERIRDRLLKTGELTDDDARQLSDQELVPYLFKPGFTTAAVGETSGRGVGLDVVTDAMRKLQGRVNLESTSSQGTRFEITVPVTISTVRIVSVVVRGQYFGIPVSAIVRTGRAKRIDLVELAGGLVLPIDGPPVRWTHLADVLGISSGRQLTNDETWPYLLVTQNGKLVAIAADALKDEAEVLLKPLSFPLAALPGVIGATIRPDGAVQLVLDVANGSGGVVAAAISPPNSPSNAARRILLVDDSPTTRAILRNVFTSAGYVVVVATDGMDALEKLRTLSVDLVVSDVEMPRLNGFDLTRQIKAKYGFPVILVTGREKEEHRLEGMEAGADAYVVKSTFEGRGLLEIVEQFV